MTRLRIFAVALLLIMGALSLAAFWLAPDYATQNRDHIQPTPLRSFSWEPMNSAGTTFPAFSRVYGCHCCWLVGAPRFPVFWRWCSELFRALWEVWLKLSW